MERKRSRRATLWSVAIASVALIAAGGAVRAWLRPAFHARLEVYGTVPEFSLIDRSGKTVTRADLLGKVSVVDFFYTRCPDACPLQSAHLARLQAQLTGVQDALLVSITVDPDYDRATVLDAYAARFHADPRRWLFLTGSRAAIYALAVDGFHLAAVVSRGPEPGAGWPWWRPALASAHEAAGTPRVIELVHGSRFALVDRQARIRGYLDGTDWEAVKQLKRDLDRLLATR